MINKFNQVGLKAVTPFGFVGEAPYSPKAKKQLSRNIIDANEMSAKGDGLNFIV